MPWFFVRKHDPSLPFNRSLEGPFESEGAANAERDSVASHCPAEELSAVFEKPEGYQLPTHLGFQAMGEQTFAIFNDGSVEPVEA